MTSRRSDPRSVASNGMDDLTEVKEDVATIKETLRWHKWLLLALLAVSGIGLKDTPAANTLAAVFQHLAG